jgi:hypothetical protein
MAWTGTITVKLKGEFTFEVDEYWDAKDAESAKRQVEVELVDYCGEAFNSHRFKETWEIKDLTDNLVPDKV